MTTMKLFAFLLSISLSMVQAQDAAYVPFAGAKSFWHDDFERQDFVMDETTLAITPQAAPEGEKFAIKDPAAGQRRCVVVVPKTPAAGQPWSWQGCYWNHEPQTEVELLRRGFHVAYISANQTLKPGKEWDAWYAFLTEKHGLSKKPAFIGMSRGGEYAYTWATAHPESVSCIYADNPGGNSDMLSRLGALAAQDVPLLHVCGSLDPLIGRFSNTIETIYQQLGGRISLIIKDGQGHHPHSLHDGKLIPDFITHSVNEVRPPAPTYLQGRTTHTTIYSGKNEYREAPKDGTFLTCHGPLFTECYERYSFELKGVDGSINVIQPKNAAPHKPWIFRAEVVTRADEVDLALLNKGFHIVTGPISYNANAPIHAHWNQVHDYLVAQGFSAKPMLEGTGRGAGELYAWAMENPEKVAGVYAVNPVLKKDSVNHLASLAKIKIPLIHVCGSLDPAIQEHSTAVQQAYESLGGKFSLIMNEGAGHYPLAPSNPQTVVELLAKISSL
jgi:hypothetical protein